MSTDAGTYDIQVGPVLILAMLTHRSLPVPVRFIGEALEGAAKPVGGDDDGYVKLQDEQRERERPQAVAAKARRGDAIGRGQDDDEDGLRVSSSS